jgi:hypothetical protein
MTDMFVDDGLWERLPFFLSDRDEFLDGHWAPFADSAIEFLPTPFDGG